MSSLSEGFGLVAGISGYDLCVGTKGSGMCDTLRALGASDVDLGAVGVGQIDAADLLNELTGNYGAPIVPASSASDIVLGDLGAAGDAVAAGVKKVTDPIGNFLASIGAWFSAHWIWLVAGIVGILLLIVWAYGGFRLGFLGG